jgi:hypothetical protein
MLADAGVKIGKLETMTVTTGRHGMPNSNGLGIPIMIIITHYSIGIYVI